MLSFKSKTVTQSPLFEPSRLSIYLFLADSSAVAVSSLSLSTRQCSAVLIVIGFQKLIGSLSERAFGFLGLILVVNLPLRSARQLTLFRLSQQNAFLMNTRTHLHFGSDTKIVCSSSFANFLSTAVYVFCFSIAM